MKVEIDFKKPLRATIHDADTEHYGKDKMVVDVQGIMLPHLPYTTEVEILFNGGKSSSFEFLPQQEEVSE